MEATLLFLAVVSGPLLYVVVSYFGERARTYEEYHLASRSLEPAELTDTTVAYGLQVAVFTLFATWGFQYGFASAWVPIFWALGYFLIVQLLRSKLLDNFLSIENPGTIHQFAARMTNLKAVAMIAALASLIGITGPAMYEAQFTGDLTARLMLSIASSSEVAPLRGEYGSLLFFAFLCCAAVYMLYGGYRSVVRTDSIQLGIAYVAIVIVLQVLVFRFASTQNRSIALVIAFVILAINATLLLLWRRAFPKKHFLHATPLMVGVTSSIVGLAALAFSSATSPAGAPIYTFSQFAQDQQLYSPLAMGGWTLMSLFFANTFYQLVDVGQWQRMAAVRFNSQDPDRSKAEIASALTVAAFYSAATWLLAILFGMLLRYAAPAVASDPYDALGIFCTQMFSTGALFDQILICTLLAGLIAAMLSTVDSLVASITFTIHNDWLVVFTDKLRNRWVGRSLTVIFLGVAFVFYATFVRRVSNFSDILYCCWAAQLALLPTIVSVLRGKRASGIAAFLSIATGIGLAFIPIIFAGWTPPIGPAFSPYTHSPILSPLGALLVFIALNRVESAPTQKDVSV